MSSIASEIKGLLLRLDFDLESVFQLVTRLCHEAHMDDDEIADRFEGCDVDVLDVLEIISDTADEVLMKVQAIIVEARLAISLVGGETEK